MSHCSGVGHDIIRGFFDFISLKSKSLEDAIVALQGF